MSSESSYGTSSTERSLDATNDDWIEVNSRCLFNSFKSTVPIARATMSTLQMQFIGQMRTDMYVLNIVVSKIAADVGASKNASKRDYTEVNELFGVCRSYLLQKNII